MLVLDLKSINFSKISLLHSYRLINQQGFQTTSSENEDEEASEAKLNEENQDVNQHSAKRLNSNGWYQCIQFQSLKKIKQSLMKKTKTR